MNTKAKKRKPTTDAVEILHRRYFEGKPEMLAMLEEARVVADAQMGLHAALSLSPRRLLVFLEEDKGVDHDILAAGSVGGRGWVDG